MAKYYHGTYMSNLGSIVAEGLIPKWEGIYLTDSKESAFRWTALKAQALGEGVLVVEVELDGEDELVPGTDHSPVMEKVFGVGKSILFTGDLIPPQKISNYFEYEIL